MCGRHHRVRWRAPNREELLKALEERQRTSSRRSRTSTICCGGCGTRARRHRPSPLPRSDSRPPMPPEQVRSGPARPSRRAVPRGRDHSRSRRSRCRSLPGPSDPRTGPRLLDDHLDGGQVPLPQARGVHGSVDGAFGDQHVRPEVPEPARVPGAASKRGHPVFEGQAEDGVLDLEIVDTRAGSPPAYAPEPRSAHQRRPSAGAETTPRRTASNSSSATKVAQIGMPRVVPGPVDRVQKPAPIAARGCSCSSPRTLSAGRSAASIRRSSLSTARSASVTGVRSALISIARPDRKRGSEIASAASASPSARVAGRGSRLRP